MEKKTHLRALNLCLPNQSANLCEIDSQDELKVMEDTDLSGITCRHCQEKVAMLLEARSEDRAQLIADLMLRQEIDRVLLNEYGFC